VQNRKACAARRSARVEKEGVTLFLGTPEKKLAEIVSELPQKVQIGQVEQVF
jgi:hypothetical protein